MEQLLRSELRTATLRALGRSGGGCISEGHSYDTDAGPVFVKVNRRAQVRGLERGRGWERRGTERARAWEGERGRIEGMERAKGDAGQGARARGVAFRASGLAPLPLCQPAALNRTPAGHRAPACSAGSPAGFYPLQD